MYPKIYLAMDNCVFYKRWTRPREWAEKMAELGIRHIEASADTELDPLYMGRAYLKDWVREVKAAEAACGVRVANLYSGHGTYTTLGLAHTDARVREHLVENWFFPMLEVAGELGCGMGFFAHAFNHDVLQSEALYREYVEILTEILARINRRAAEVGCGELGIEQMYTPHQYPWRLEDSRDLMREVTRRSGRDFYFTEDVGHHHVIFAHPDVADVGTKDRGLWLGTDRAYGLRDAAAIAEDVRRNPQLFARPEDGDCYRTLRELGCYSPIIHLQQTDGRRSSHLPFTAAENERGIISGEKVLAMLREAYDQPEDGAMPKRVEAIYLTLELFSGTTSIMRDVLKDCEESVKYWRQYIPEDGLPLDVLLERLK